MTGVYDDANCAPAHLVNAGRTLHLTSPVVADGVRLFRATLYVCVPFDERCDEIALTEASALHVRFQPTTVQVSQTTSAWVKRWEGDTQEVTVELVYPAPIGKVVSSHFAHVAFHRVDGDAVSDDATLEGATGTSLAEPFVGPSFRAKFTQPRPKDEILLIEQPAKSSKISKAAKAQTEAVSAEATNPAVSLLGLAGPRFDLSGTPSSARLRLLDAESGEALWQWIEPGEQANASYAAAGAELLAALEPALGRALELERQRTSSEPGGETPGTSTLVLPLVIESDAPCRVVLDAANLEFVLATELFDEPAELAFDGSALARQERVLSSLPPGPLAVDFETTLVEHEARAAVDPPPLAEAALHTGVRVDEGTGAAVVWEAERPYRAMGFAIGFHALSANAKLAAALLPDAGGRFAATPVAEANLELETQGPSWVRFRWKPVELQPGRYWLRLLVSKGAGLWLALPAPLQSLWLQRTAVDGAVTAVPLAPLVHPLEPEPTPDTAPPPFALALSGAPIPLDGSGETFTGALDIAATALASQSSWLLEAASPNALRLTVRSARVTYRPA